MLENVVPIICEFMPVWQYFLLPVFALAFLATVPVLIRKVLQWR